MKKYWVDVGNDEEFYIEAVSSVVMESGVLVFFDVHDTIVAAFKTWENVQIDYVRNLVLPQEEE